MMALNSVPFLMPNKILDWVKLFWQGVGLLDDNIHYRIIIVCQIVCDKRIVLAYQPVRIKRKEIAWLVHRLILILFAKRQKHIFRITGEIVGLKSPSRFPDSALARARSKRRSSGEGCARVFVFVGGTSPVVQRKGFVPSNPFSWGLDLGGKKSIQCSCGFEATIPTSITTIPTSITTIPTSITTIPVLLPSLFLSLFSVHDALLGILHLAGCATRLCACRQSQ